MNKAVLWAITVLSISLVTISCKKSIRDSTPVEMPHEKKWVVTTIAGNGTGGLKDGPALSAAFALPGDVLIAPDGTIYVADFLN